MQSQAAERGEIVKAHAADGCAARTDIRRDLPDAVAAAVPKNGLSAEAKKVALRCLDRRCNGLL